MVKYYEQLSWDEFEAARDAGDIFVLSVGAIEQHGRHLPLGVDHIIPYELMSKRISQFANVVMMAPIYYGYRSQTVVGGGVKYPGTVRMSSESIAFPVRDIVLEMFRHNVKKLVIINGHLENKGFIQDGIERALQEYNGEQDTKIMYLEWNSYVKNDTLDTLFGGKFPGWDPEHAAVCETSLMLALCPELVKVDLLPDESAKRYTKYSIWPSTEDMVTENGALAPARLASVANGELMLSDIVPGIIEDFEFEFGTNG